MRKSDTIATRPGGVVEPDSEMVKEKNFQK